MCPIVVSFGSSQAHRASLLLPKIHALGLQERRAQRKVVSPSWQGSAAGVHASSTNPRGLCPCHYSPIHGSWGRAKYLSATVWGCTGYTCSSSCTESSLSSCPDWQLTKHHGNEAACWCLKAGRECCHYANWSHNGGGGDLQTREGISVCRQETQGCICICFVLVSVLLIVAMMLLSIVAWVAFSPNRRFLSSNPNCSSRASTSSLTRAGRC